MPAKPFPMPFPMPFPKLFPMPSMPFMLRTVRRGGGAPRRSSKVYALEREKPLMLQRATAKQSPNRVYEVNPESK